MTSRWIPFAPTAAPWIASSMGGLAGLLLGAFVMLPQQVEVRPGPDPYLVTLTARDDLSATVDFETGTRGVRVVDGELNLDNADIAYGMFREGLLSFGFRDNERAKIVDLGDFRVPSVRRSGDRSPKPPISVVHSMSLQGSKTVYRAPINKNLRLLEADAVFGKFTGSGMQHVEPRLGHVYILRYTTPLMGGSDGKVIAFQVVDLEPGRRVLLRFNVLR